MKSTHLLAMCIVCTLTLNPLAASQASGEAASQDNSGEIETIDFPGGSVVEYVELLRESVPDANFVLMPGIEEFSIPPMRLHNVALTHAAFLIQEVSIAPSTGRKVVVNSRGDIFTIRPYSTGQAVRSESLVISLADVISDDLPPEDVLTSIETALGLFNDASPQVSVRFHEATALLIARGRADQMGSIRRVVTEMQRNKRTGNTSAQLEAVTEQRDKLAEELAKREDDLRRANVEIQSLERLVHSLEAQRDDAHRAQAEIQSLEWMVRELESQLQQAKPQQDD